MKRNPSTSPLTNSTAVSIFLITMVAIAAVFVATYQVDRGVVAPTAPESQPQAAEINSSTCRLAFNVVANGPLADLQLRKDVSDSTPTVGDQITFTISLYNAGPDTATGVTVEDVLPSGLTYISATPQVGSFNPANGIWTVGTITSNTTYTLALVARVDSSAQITNIAEVQSSETPDPNSTPNNNVPTENDQDSEVINPTNPGADLDLDKKVNNSTPRQGEEVTFTVTVRNSGPDAATGVTVKDIIPSGTTYISSTANQGSFDIATGIWTIGRIEPNTSFTLNLVARIDTTEPVRNIAEVQTNNVTDPDSTPGNNNPNEDDYDYADITPVKPGADLSLIKRVNNQTPRVGDEITFTVEVYNAGPSQANDVTVRDMLPTGVTFVGANASHGSYNSGNGTWTIGSLTRGSTAILEMKVRVTASGQIRNVAEVWTSSEVDPDSTPGNNNPNEDDYDERIIGQAALPRAGSNSRTTLFVVATGIVVLIIGAMGLLLFL